MEEENIEEETEEEKQKKYWENYILKNPNVCRCCQTIQDCLCSVLYDPDNEKWKNNRKIVQNKIELEYGKFLFIILELKNKSPKFVKINILGKVCNRCKYFFFKSEKNKNRRRK